jgi:hypothetical protein
MMSQKKKTDETASDKYKEAKDILDNTLKNFQTLGQLASQGASMVSLLVPCVRMQYTSSSLISAGDMSDGLLKVFGPSNLCFNAVSYLISTVAKYKNIFSSITKLFEHVWAFLDRFGIHASAPISLDVRLKMIILQLLRSFTRICALSARVAKQHKTLLYLKVFAFDTDAGLKAERDKFEALVTDELSTSVVLILTKVNRN